MKSLAASVDWRPYGPAAALVTITSPIRHAEIVPTEVFDSTPIDRWSSHIVAPMIRAATREEPPMPIERRRSTCTTCSGPIYRYPNKLDADPCTDSWAHLNVRDHVGNPHDAVPEPGDLAAHVDHAATLPDPEQDTPA